MAIYVLIRDLMPVARACNDTLAAAEQARRHYREFEGERVTAEAEGLATWMTQVRDESKIERLRFFLSKQSKTTWTAKSPALAGLFV